MKEVAKILIALVLIVLAWKIVKGLLALLITIGAVALFIWGGMKLVEGARR